MLGGGGHASVLLDALQDGGNDVIGVISPSSLSPRKIFSGITRYSSDSEFMSTFAPHEVVVVNGIGPAPKADLRQRLQSEYEAHGFEFISVVSPRARISNFAEREGAVQVMAGATVQAGVVLGKASVINTCAVIDHDCRLGKYVHVGPGATLCGGVVLEKRAYVGANATVFPGVKICEGAVIGAGAVVKKNIGAGVVVLPAPSLVKGIGL